MSELDGGEARVETVDWLRRRRGDRWTGPGGPERELPTVVPETRYAQSGDVHIAYQVVGDGETDLVLVPEFWNSIEAQ